MSDKDIFRLILGFGAVGIVMLIEDEMEYYDGGEGFFLGILVIALCLLGIVMLLPVGLKGLPEAVARKASLGKTPSGGAFSSEALGYFEAHPYESTYTDSQGRSWDNTGFGDY